MRDGAGVLFTPGPFSFIWDDFGRIPLSGAPQPMMGFGMHQQSKSWYRGALLGGLIVPLLAGTGWAQRPAPLTPGLLRVCADMDNLPFSNQKGEGYENKIAELIAKEWHSRLEYTWWPIRRGYYRMLNGTYCDLVIESPVGVDQAGATKPYYRSGYMFLSRRGSGLETINSLADPRLKKLKIGVNLFVSSDGEHSPPEMALSRYGVVGNLVGYSVAYDDTTRPEAIINAVAKKEVDVAIVWGPQAGYFVKKSPVPLVLTPLATEVDTATGYPMSYNIGMAVRRRDHEFRDSLQTLLDRKHSEILGILKEYGVPAFPVKEEKGEKGDDDDGPKTSAPPSDSTRASKQ
ncbi:MAG: quinoprotein dehydrogenase-associated putative ABC transporter substrate-binding protein [Gemmatimonadales bacterium]